MTDTERFSELCKQDAYMPRPLSGVGISIYNEKRLHRILKSYISGNESAYEIPMGRYVADIFENGHITEIQTANMERLLPKLRFYLENTEYSVTVVYPIIRNKIIFRVDGDSGELIRQRMSPDHGKLWDALPPLYHIRELLPNDRLTVRVLLIDASEYRYSEAIRYRKEGRYVSELFPTELVLELELSDLESFKQLLPDITHHFTAAEYSAVTKRKGRDLYSALNLFCSLGLLDRQKDGKRYVYKKAQSDM